MNVWDWFWLAFAVGMGWHMAYTVYAIVVDTCNYAIRHTSVAYHRYMHKRMCRKVLKVDDGHEVS